MTATLAASTPARVLSEVAISCASAAPCASLHAGAPIAIDWLNACRAALKHGGAVESRPPLEAMPLGQRLHSQRGNVAPPRLVVVVAGAVEHAAGSVALFFFFVDALTASVLP